VVWAFAAAGRRKSPSPIDWTRRVPPGVDGRNGVCMWYGRLPQQDAANRRVPSIGLAACHRAWTAETVVRKTLGDSPAESRRAARTGIIVLTKRAVKKQISHNNVSGQPFDGLINNKHRSCKSHVTFMECFRVYSADYTDIYAA
jgi:hypothetical protein